MAQSRHSAKQSVDSTISLETIFSTLSLESVDAANNEYVNHDIDVLVEDALVSIIEKATFTQTLRGGISPKELLRHMLLDAPHSRGKRYIALALHVAAQKGSKEVERLALVLLDNLLFPLQAQMSVFNHAMPSSSQTPTIDHMATLIESADRSDQCRLRDMLFEREQGQCAMTGFIDSSRVPEDAEQSVAGVSLLEAAHIIPLGLNKFNEPNLAATTWDILKNWTSIDLDYLVGAIVKTPRNAILMNVTDRQNNFGKFKIWFEPIPGHKNAYAVKTARRVRLANGKVDGIAQFRSKDFSGIEPPDPDLLRVHAAFAKVLHACGAADVYAKWEQDFHRRGLFKDEQSMIWLGARLNMIASE